MKSLAWAIAGIVVLLGSFVIGSELVFFAGLGLSVIGLLEWMGEV